MRITAIDHVLNSVMWPRLDPLLQRYPELKIEISADYRMVDIDADRYDIGVRWGNQVERDMIAVRMTAEQPMVIVASPGYLAVRGVPCTSQDLLRHNCITLRPTSGGGICGWALEHKGRKTEAKVTGQTVFTSVYPMLQAALSGHALVFVTADLARRHVEAGRLVSVMQEWCPLFPGLHACYSRRRNPTRALTVVIEALREPLTSL
ncbi:LysR substrate-binding domain-containing protein [Ideonella azotifigens]|uniref:LysR substrate-binding domain-containing protein n=1 Tax=Ideonella azotifigens TaxID=513160 RepID=UPI0021750CE8|nr:LysR substrate-binding domain-containing protein [Ideonella azotifigens]